MNNPKNENKKMDEGIACGASHPKKGLIVSSDTFQASTSGLAGTSNTGKTGVLVQPSLKTRKRNKRKSRAKKGRKLDATTPTSSELTTGDRVKRSIKEISTPSPENTATYKRPREEFPPRTYSKAVSGTKMAIVKNGFPDDKLSVEDEKSIQIEIINFIDCL